MKEKKTEREEHMEKCMGKQLPTTMIIGMTGKRNEHKKKWYKTYWLFVMYQSSLNK